MIEPKRRLAQLNSCLSQLSPRERILSTLVVMAIIFFVMEIFLFAPQEKHRRDVRIVSDKAFSELMVYQAELNSKTNKSLQDPALKIRSELDALRRKNREIDLQLRKMEDEFTARQEPARLLQELLQQNSGLRVIEVKKGELEPYAFSGAVPGSKNPALVRQSVEIELEGSFMAFLEYLQRVENSSLVLFWDDLELRVVEHPFSRFVLKVHTLSPAKEVPNV
ncbi:MAG: hypothetical protein JXK94_04075 [Deltaproteobacteria bacterium]|nr:hypothetical protein [Deltaproteobacteria bacterium]